jgi:hypothetical protein
MEQDGDVKDIRNDLDQRIVGHEIGVVVEGYATVMIHQLEVAQQVHQQEKDEEYSGNAHHDLLAYGRPEQKID